jgi:hypothetical protein
VTKSSNAFRIDRHCPATRRLCWHRHHDVEEKRPVHAEM